jgi:hypothetical protein
MPHQKAAWQYQKQGLVFKNVSSVVVKSLKAAWMRLIFRQRRAWSARERRVKKFH